MGVCLFRQICLGDRAAHGRGQGIEGRNHRGLSGPEPERVRLLHRRRRRQVPQKEYTKTPFFYIIKAKDKDAYRRKHESSLILYEASGKALKDAGIKKLPKLTDLQKEYAALQKKKDAIYSDYGKRKNKVK